MITVFTPTYNRAKTLHRVWDSLNSQSYKDFEWIVVDDGSTDSTPELIERYKSEASFPVTFFRQPTNLGKHFAINKGVELAQGDFFVIADSDDGFTADALQIFIQTWNSIPTHDRTKYCGVRTCCVDQLGNRVSDFVPEPFLDATMAEAFYRYKFMKESWCMTLTSSHRQFMFPAELQGNYFPESIVWKAMSRKLLLRFINAPTRIFYREADEVSIQRGRKPPGRVAISKLEVVIDALNHDTKYFFRAPRIFVSYIILFLIHIFYTPQPFSFVRRLNFPLRATIIPFLPLGVVLNWIYTRRKSGAI